VNYSKEEYFEEGKLVLMWDKRKGELNMNKEFYDLWKAPYKVGNNSIDDSYYLAMLEGRRLPLPINVSLLKPHYGEET
jgi:hypothetical protein